MSTYTAIGCMSGSSLDGLDICHVEFTGDIDTDVWGYRILKGITLPYTEDWQERLGEAANLSAQDFVKLHVDYGHFIGQSVKQFLATEDIHCVDLFASHGHTIFHQPERCVTFQLGEGETTSSYINFPFVDNFRSKDLALGGQGAPLVPVGEKYLFSQSDVCINLGGIANIGIRGTKGHDICPCNFVLNKLAFMSDGSSHFDKDGEIASKGNVLFDVLGKLEALPFYQQAPPKSLGREWIEENVFPVIDTEKYSVQDLMRTFVEHITNRISDAIQTSFQILANEVGRVGTLDVLITGGGAFNKFLVSNLKNKIKSKDIKLEEADTDTINFKEALIFAFLGLRCLLGLENIMCDVTGSESDSVSGSIHLPLVPSQFTPTKIDRFNFKFRRQRSSSSTTSY